MKLDSKLFDTIRIRPRRAEKPAEEAPACAWEGCTEPGLHRAPKGHRAEGQYHNFCMEHVRHYNAAFNFFAGMNPDEIEASIHRKPADAPKARSRFSLGGNGTAYRPGTSRPREDGTRRFSDPLNIFARYNWSQSKNPRRERVAPLHELDRRAFEMLGFDKAVPSDEIKRAYKALVKIHHPDANGGDTSSEERLRAIISAYTHLKNKGFVAR